MPIARVNDIEVYYEVHGEGPPLVMILGLGSDITQYRRIITRLARTRHVIAFDNRGSGRSDKPDVEYSMDMMADDTAALMDRLSIDHAEVLGISMGGRIAMSLAVNHPHRVSRLVLVCTGPHKFSRLRISLPMLAVVPFRRLPPFRSRYRAPRYAFLRQRAATFDFEIGDRLAEIRVPTMIMHGLRDKTALYANALEMHEAIHGSELVTFSGGHLFFMLAERQRFLTEVRRFLAP